MERPPQPVGGPRVMPQSVGLAAFAALRGACPADAAPRSGCTLDVALVGPHLLVEARAGPTWASSPRAGSGRVASGPAAPGHAPGRPQSRAHRLLPRRVHLHVRPTDFTPSWQALLPSHSASGRRAPRHRTRRWSDMSGAAGGATATRGGACWSEGDTPQAVSSPGRSATLSFAPSRRSSHGPWPRCPGHASMASPPKSVSPNDPRNSIRTARMCKRPQPPLQSTPAFGAAFPSRQWM
jgi:hypothetical protein